MLGTSNYSVVCSSPVSTVSTIAFVIAFIRFVNLSDQESGINLLVFTELDGNLLDRGDYSYEAAKGGLDRIFRQQIPMIFTTSKTRLEIDRFRRTCRSMSRLSWKTGRLSISRMAIEISKSIKASGNPLTPLSSWGQPIARSGDLSTL